jgi:hypothetical protein
MMNRCACLGDDTSDLLDIPVDSVPVDSSDISFIGGFSAPPVPAPLITTTVGQQNLPTPPSLPASALALPGITSSSSSSPSLGTALSQLFGATNSATSLFSAPSTAVSPPPTVGFAGVANALGTNPTTLTEYLLGIGAVVLVIVLLKNRGR